MSSTDPTTEKPVLPRADARAGEPIARPDRSPPGAAQEEAPRPAAPKSRPAPIVSRADAAPGESAPRVEPAPAGPVAEKAPADSQASIERLGTFGPDDPLLGYLAVLFGFGHKTGEYLKGLASWRLVETESGAPKSSQPAGDEDPLWATLKKITYWGLTEDRREGPFRDRRNYVDEDPIVEWYHQARAYLKSLELFKPGPAATEYKQRTGAYLNRLGATLKDAASWRTSTLKGFLSWRLDGAGESASGSEGSWRGSLQGFADMWRRSGGYLKGVATWRVTDAGSEATDRDPDPLLASLKSLALWRVSLKDLATWRFTERSDAEPDRAERDASQDQFLELWRQAGDYLKGLATWRVTEGGGSEAASDPDSFGNALKALATWRLPEPRKETMAPLVETEPAYKFDVLASALSRNDVRRSEEAPRAG
jgi:hypothetical protein